MILAGALAKSSSLDYLGKVLTLARRVRHKIRGLIGEAHGLM